MLIEMGYAFMNHKGFIRNIFVHYKVKNSIVKKRNYESVFETQYRYDSYDETKRNLYGNLYFDFDSNDNYEEVKADALRVISFFYVIYKIEKKDIEIYYSGSKGIHLIISGIILGIEPRKDLNSVFKHIVLKVKQYTGAKTIDTGIYDNKRMFRIVNTKHEKSGLYKIRITYKQLQTLNVKEVRKMAEHQGIPVKDKHCFNKNANAVYKSDIQDYLNTVSTNNEKDGEKQKRTLTYIPPCIKNLLEEGIGDGQRNLATAALSSFYRNFGNSIDETTVLINDWNANNTPPLTNGEIATTIKSIYSNKSNNYGCYTLRTLAECDIANCRLKKKEETAV